ncbi:hypothetical protein [Candidatus Electronema sp. PJ]|uniref:hypothetical protein n=1 Tax=Candidatus Electronema sp. PJ TaxID=3401572 RepID=UPI003AA85B80
MNKKVSFAGMSLVLGAMLFGSASFAGTDEIPMDVTGIVLTRTGALNDQAQLKLKNVTDIKQVVTDAINNAKNDPSAPPYLIVDVSSGSTQIANVIIPLVYLDLNLGNVQFAYSGTQGRSLLRCVFDTQECVLGLYSTDFIQELLPNMTANDVIVKMTVGDTVYVDSSPGGWDQVNSGNGTWTKYIKN